MMTSKRLITSFMVSAGLLVGSASAAAQSGTDIYAGDWPDYHGNKESQRYSPLDQINADNVNSLEIAWRFSFFVDKPVFYRISFYEFTLIAIGIFDGLHAAPSI